MLRRDWSGWSNLARDLASRVGSWADKGHHLPFLSHFSFHTLILVSRLRPYRHLSYLQPWTSERHASSSRSHNHALVSTTQGRQRGSSTSQCRSAWEIRIHPPNPVSSPPLQHLICGVRAGVKACGVTVIFWLVPDPRLLSSSHYREMRSRSCVAVVIVVPACWCLLRNVARNQPRSRVGQGSWDIRVDEKIDPTHTKTNNPRSHKTHRTHFNDQRAILQTTTRLRGLGPWASLPV